MADYRCYLTNAGIAAENNARNSGTTFKITEMVLDGAYLSDELNPENLTDVINPELTLPCTTALSDDGQTLTIKSVVVVPGGDFRVWGIGLKTNEGVLYAYARSKGDQILNEYDGVVESIRYALDVITLNADVIEINVDYSTVYADLEYVGVRVNQIINMMKKMEGKLGRVRIYMADNIDDDYLPILGQTILKSDYPDYFEHLGIVDDELTLPDWSLHPYLHQASGDVPAGTTLEQQLLRHVHTASTSMAEDHVHEIDNKDLGTKNSKPAGKHKHIYDKLQNGNKLFVENHGGGGEYVDAYTDEEPDHTHQFILGEHNHSMRGAGGHEHDVEVDEFGEDLLRPNSTAVVYAVKVKFLVDDIAA